MRRARLGALAFAAALVALATPASAQSLPQLLFNNGGQPPQLSLPGGVLFTSLANSAWTIETYIAQYANMLFVGLVALDIAWTAGQALLTRSDVGELMVQLGQKAITFNFIYWVFVVNGFGIVTTVINSFIQLGTNTLSQIQGPIPAPQDPLGLIFLGIGIASPMLVEATVLGAVPDEVLGNGATNLMTGLIDVNVIGAVLTIGAYAFLAGTLALAIVEAYIVTSAGIVVTGFLGSRWTVSIGERYFSYAVSVGVKLLMVYICIGLINPLGGEIVGFSLIPVIGPMAAGFIALIAAMIAFSAPQFAASLISGSSNSSFGQFVGTVAGAVSAGSGLTSGLLGIGAGGGAKGAGGTGAAAGASGGAQTALAASGERSSGVDTNAAPSVPTALSSSQLDGPSPDAPAQTPGSDFSSNGTTSASSVADALEMRNANFALSPGGRSGASNGKAPATEGSAPVQGTRDDSVGRGTSRGQQDPNELEDGAYEKMSAAELRRNVSPRSIGEMTRSQLEEVRRNPAFEALAPERQSAVSKALTAKRLESRRDVIDSLNTVAQGFAKTMPAHDHGSTGAVSIRVNV